MTRRRTTWIRLIGCYVIAGVILLPVLQSLPSSGQSGNSSSFQNNSQKTYADRTSGHVELTTQRLLGTGSRSSTLAQSFKESKPFQMTLKQTVDPRSEVKQSEDVYVTNGTSADQGQVTRSAFTVIQESRATPKRGSAQKPDVATIGCCTTNNDNNATMTSTTMTLDGVNYDDADNNDDENDSDDDDGQNAYADGETSDDDDNNDGHVIDDYKEANPDEGDPFPPGAAAADADGIDWSRMLYIAENITNSSIGANRDEEEFGRDYDYNQTGGGGVGEGGGDKDTEGGGANAGRHYFHPIDNGQRFRVSPPEYDSDNRDYRLGVEYHNFDRQIGQKNSEMRIGGKLHRGQTISLRWLDHQPVNHFAIFLWFVAALTLVALLLTAYRFRHAVVSAIQTTRSNYKQGRRFGIEEANDLLSHAHV